MRIGASLFLIAVGAILKFAVNTQNTHGFNVGTAGVILMIIGALGLVITAVMLSTRRRTDVIEHGPAGRRGTTYVTPNDTAAPY
jgi:membrane-bound ClpP family serine protease